MLSEAPEYFIELMNDKHIQIRKLSSVVVTSMAVSIHCVYIYSVL